MSDKDDGEFTPEMKAETWERIEKTFEEKYDVPSEASGFDGATPQDLARALLRPIRNGDG